MDERDVTNAWRDLVLGKESTPETFAKAATLLGRLRSESPLRFRLSSELDTLRNGPQVHEKKHISRPKAI